MPHKSEDFKISAVEYYLDSIRLKKFLEDNITSKYKNKAIILDNKLIYSVPYQHFTNAIEHYFSILKSRLQKLEGLTYNELKLNVGKVIRIYQKKPTRIY